MILSARKVSKTYGSRDVLRECSLTVNSGECLLIRGPSGGGKSTLLRILSLLEQADSGCVLYNDRILDVSLPTKTLAYPFLTMVFQQLFLWPNLTMRQNLSMVLGHRPNNHLPYNALELLNRFMIAHVLDCHPHECSLGERQRLAIARSLLSQARFLLLDEPSSALDRDSLAVLVQELRAAMACDRGVLLITHDERGFDGIVDELFELESGQLRQL